MAQSALEFSSDGYRWVEFEVAIFRNRFPDGFSGEISNRERLNLNYLPRLRKLTEPSASLAYPFPADQIAMPAALQATGLPMAGQLPEIAQPSAYTARFSPALPGSFRINDLARDPFIALPQDNARSVALLRKLESSPDYQLLWHQTWRQPLVPRSQVGAVLVQAGNRSGDLNELEGSIRFSDNGAGLAQVDLNVWLSIFNQLEGETAAAWKLPELPLALRAQPTQTGVSPEQNPASAIAIEAQLPQPLIEMVWQQETNRDIAGTLLYYLDHPQIGVLIQARSYLLPVIELPEAAEDF